ncbi:hypothetical protein EVAR_66419_1 [Eumeta japonica]|uniref:Uncharacterized protein n=1 Tax=Eumeta variegata TaxID=151549 RepID=A0A4C1ZUV8_EUMVA|nr:hypothetical protein EVAR_66419_1 [Eumeta japonica]
MRYMTTQTMKNFKLAPQHVECSTVVAYSYLKDIAESLIYDTAAPCIVIGQDNWGSIVSQQIKSGRTNQSVLSLTQPSWVLRGCCSSLSRPINTIHHLRLSSTSDDELHNIIKDLSVLNPPA